MDYSNGLFDCQSPTSPFLGGLRVLHLLEDLRAALELMDNEERDNLRCQIPDSTAEGVAEWLHGRLVRRPLVKCVSSALQSCIWDLLFSAACRWSNLWSERFLSLWPWVTLVISIVLCPDEIQMGINPLTLSHMCVSTWISWVTCKSGSALRTVRVRPLKIGERRYYNTLKLYMSIKSIWKSFKSCTK